MGHTLAAADGEMPYRRQQLSHEHVVATDPDSKLPKG
jgi:hypothetical protein